MKGKENADNAGERIARIERMVEQLQKDADQSQAGPGEERIAHIERMVEQLKKAKPTGSDRST